jgi:GNAT superfamily N-acetyltransferase
MRGDDVARVADLTAQLGYPSTPEQIAARFAHLRTRPEDELLIAVDERDQPVGWIHVSRFASLEASDVALIGGLVVDDAHRSAGIGEALLAAGEAWAREHGASTMVVRSRITRERAHRFYERHGYATVKTSHVFEKPLTENPLTE